MIAECGRLRPEGSGGQGLRLPSASFGEQTMRHPERKIESKETMIALLERSAVGRMATVNRKGFPVIKPVNYVYWKGKVYLHSSTRGEKIRDLRRGSPVCFEVDEPVAYVTAMGPTCRSTYYFRSIIVKGTGAIVNQPAKKLKVIEKLMEKYQPEGGYGGVAEEVLRKTAVVEISIREMTGKERLG